MRYFKIVILSLFALLCLPLESYATENLVWNLNEGKLTISGVGEMPIFETAYDQPWYDIREQIEEVYFVGTENMCFDNLQYYFTGCTNLRKAEIPYTAKVVGTEAFANCPNLTEIFFYYYDTDEFEIVEGAFYSDTHVDTKVYLVSDQTYTVPKIQDYVWAEDNRHTVYYDVYSLQICVSICPKCGLTPAECSCNYCSYCGQPSGYHLDSCPKLNGGSSGGGSGVAHSSNCTGSNTVTYTSYNATQHQARRVCSCGASSISTLETHVLTTTYAVTDTTHTASSVCSLCQYTSTSAAAPHGYYNDVCRTCGYTAVAKSGTLADIPEGSVVYINESGYPQAFYVAKHNYESGLNGLGRTLLWRANAYDKRLFNVASTNTYTGSTIDTWLNSEYVLKLDPSVQQQLGPSKYYGTASGNDTSVSVFESNVFLPSVTEMDLSFTCNVEGSAFTSVANYRVTYYDGLVTFIWTRTPHRGSTTHSLISNGSAAGSTAPTSVNGARPCFTLPSSAYIVGDGTVKSVVTVTWNNDGTTSTSTLYAGDSVVLPTAPTKTGYTFKGWYTAASSGTQITSSTKVPSTATTYYAQWTINTSTLTIAPNGGTWEGSTSNTSKTQNYNTTLTVANPTPTNYTATFNSNGGSSVVSKTTNKAFSSWSKSSTFTAGTLSGTTFTFGATKGGTGTLTANYSGSYVITLPSAPTRTGYTFNGWYTAASSGTKVGNADASVTLSKSITYYAQWTINTSTLTVNPNGGTWEGSTSNTSKTQNYNTTLSIPNPTITNYTASFNSNGGTSVSSITTNKAFSSWTSSGNAGTLSGTTFTFGSTKGGTGTLTAAWSGSYEVTLPSAPSRTGYAFAGWSDGTTTKAANSKVTLSKNTSYTAQWVRMLSVTVPTSVGIAVSSSGTAYAQPIAVINNSPEAVKVTYTGASVASGWSVVDPTTDMSRVKVDSKQFAFIMSGGPTWTIAEWQTLSIPCSVSFSATSTAYSDEPLLTLRFVIDWASA